MTRRISIILCAFSLTAQAFAQLRNPNDDPRYVESNFVFDTSALARIDLTMLESDYQFLLDDPTLRIEVPADMRFRNAFFDETVDSVGVRFRGGTSIVEDKRPWNIDFNEYVEDQRYHHLRQFNLVSAHNDPSIFRGQLMMDFCQRELIPAPRSHPVDLHLHTDEVPERFLGTFINVEQIDKTFLRAWYTDDEGPLWKCYYPANLLVLGDGSSEEYAFDGRYELQTTESINDYSDLAEFIMALNTISDGNFQSQFPEWFDVETYLPSLAAEVLFGHWDAHWSNQNNFWLYYIPDTGQPGTGVMQFIQYDMDNTMGVGINWAGFDVGTADVLHFGSRNRFTRPLPARVLAVDDWEDRYQEIIGDWYQYSFSTITLVPEALRYRDMIAPSVLQDVNDLDFFGAQYGFDYQDFLNSVTGTGDDLPWAHVGYGVIEYVETRSPITFGPAGMMVR